MTVRLLVAVTHGRQWIKERCGVGCNALAATFFAVRGRADPDEWERDGKSIKTKGASKTTAVRILRSPCSLRLVHQTRQERFQLFTPFQEHRRPSLSHTTKLA